MTGGTVFSKDVNNGDQTTDNPSLDIYDHRWKPLRDSPVSFGALPVHPRSHGLRRSGYGIRILSSGIIYQAEEIAQRWPV